MLKEMLEARKLPALRTREEMLDVLMREEYGYTPAAPERVCAEVVSKVQDEAFADKATETHMSLSFDTPKGTFSFPFVMIVPKAVEKPAVYVYINFRPDIPDRYLPVEELLDNGYAIATFCYNDVTKDTADESGLAAMYDRDPKTGWGKIGMWAFAASRVMDYLQTRDDLDLTRVAVSGHSRLGKTALWCGAQDERFSLTISNDSGCGGAALHRDKIGEHVEFMSRVIAYWFCGNFNNYVNREHDMPHDQHFLLACVAPRAVYVNSAQLDDWADPTSEFLSCLAASPAWEGKGLVTLEDALPSVNLPLQLGLVGYHMRSGSHFHSRTDWLYQCAFRAQHRV